jgi:hypothetical protein
MLVPRAQGVFDAAGALDAAVEGQLRKFLEGFVAFARSRPR